MKKQINNPKAKIYLKKLSVSHKGKNRNKPNKNKFMK